MFDGIEFEVYCGDELVASAGGPREMALAEAMNYASQYAQDGIISIVEVTRKQLILAPTPL